MPTGTQWDHGNAPISYTLPVACSHVIHTAHEYSYTELTMMYSCLTVNGVDVHLQVVYTEGIYCLATTTYITHHTAQYCNEPNMPGRLS